MSFFFKKKKLKELKELNPSWKSLKRLNFFFVENMTQRIELFFLNLTQRIAPTFLFHDSNTWTFFTWLKELNLLIYVTQILELFWKFWFKEMDLFFSRLKVFHQSTITHRIKFLNPTHRIDFFCELNRLISWIWRKELNPFFKISLKELNFFLRLKELNFLINMTQRTKLFFESVTQRIELFLKRCLKEFFLEVCLKEFNSFSYTTERIVFSNMTLRIELVFECDSKNWTCFFEYDSKNWTFFLFNSKNWTLLF